MAGRVGGDRVQVVIGRLIAAVVITRSEERYGGSMVLFFVEVYARMEPNAIRT